MNVRHWMKRRAGGIVLGLCALLATGGCGNTEQILHGRQFTPAGPLKVSSLGPSCGCVSLKNTSGKRIMLESTFFGIARGNVFLNPDEQTRVLFDWAGEENEDFYLIDAYEASGTTRGAKLRMMDAITEYAPFVDTPCDDNACTYNGLAMNRMMDDHEELERENPTRGIEFTSVITASAPQNECGCMMVTNFGDHDVTLRSTLHGAETGQLELRAGATLPLTFDWAGALETDVYVIDAIDVRTPGESLAAGEILEAPATRTPTTPEGSGGRIGSGMTIRLKDHVQIDGTLVNMACEADYAEFINHRSGSTAETSVRCPWRPEGQTGLGMRVAYDKRTQRAVTDAAAGQTTAQPAPKPKQ
jgi:hypothetical protein